MTDDNIATIVDVEYDDERDRFVVRYEMEDGTAIWRGSLGVEKMELSDQAIEAVTDSLIGTEVRKPW